MNDQEFYARRALATVSSPGVGAIVLEHVGDDADDPSPAYAVNVYGARGELKLYRSTMVPGDRDAILALGRAIVDALDPVPDPPQEEPVDESVRQRLEAWDSITDHPFFAPAFDVEAPLIDAMLEQLDGLCTCGPELATVELVGDPTLPLDVEIRTIALDAAVRIAVDTGNDVVTHARAIERFLVGEAEEVKGPRFVAEYIEGDGWAVADRVEPRFAPFGYSTSERVEQYAVEWSKHPERAESWGWTVRS